MKIYIPILVLFVNSISFSQPLDWQTFFQSASSKVSDDALLELVEKRGVSFEVSIDKIRLLRNIGRTHAFVQRLVEIVSRGIPQETTESISLLPSAKQEELPKPKSSFQDSSSVEFVLPKTPSLQRIGTAPIEPDQCLPQGVSVFSISKRGLSLKEVAKTFMNGRQLFERGEFEDALKQWVWASLALSRNKYPATACGILRYAVNRYSMSPNNINSQDASNQTPMDHQVLSDKDYACVLLLANEVRSKITCPFPNPYLFAERDAHSLPSNVVPFHGYFLGVDLMEEGGDAKQVRSLLEMVSSDHPDYVFALFQMAIIDIRENLFKSAAKRLLLLTELNDQRVDGVSLSELANLTLGRIAFENRLFYPAVYYYSLIPTASRLWVVATIEKAFAYLMLQNYGHAMGALVSLKGYKDVPWANKPELELIRAEAFAHACMFDMARTVALGAQKVVEDLIKDIRDYIPFIEKASNFGCDTQCLKTISDQISINTVISKIPSLIGEGVIRRGLMALNQSLTEMNTIESDPNTQSLKEVLWQTKDLYLSYVRRALLQSLMQYKNDLFSLRDRFTELMIDIESAEKDFLMYRVKEISETETGSRKAEFMNQVVELARKGLSGDEITSFVVSHAREITLTQYDIMTLRFNGVPLSTIDFISANMVKKGKLVAEVDPIGVDTRIVWDFDREYWSDELGGYSVEIPDMCKSGMEFGTPQKVLE